LRAVWSLLQSAAVGTAAGERVEAAAARRSGNRRPKGGRIEARIIAKENGTREETLYQD
jgi:hypothetical protein